MVKLLDFCRISCKRGQLLINLNVEFSSQKAAQAEQPKNGLEISLSAVLLFGIDLGFFLQHCMQLFLAGA
ncbi:hypothetical protein [Dyadobacter linearis]|uniref:hypothetical protein n=1 Tax=Dyadobacter linearis TaxID=2823330 RepID=UPI001BFC94F3|nr:hypothetical protein [Dyadobacter sp. CECT 9623]